MILRTEKNCREEIIGNSRHKWEGNDTKALKERTCGFVDWLNVHQLEERRLPWTGFTCLIMWDSEDSCGLGLPAFSCGTVRIPVDWVYLPSHVGQ
jgi:hypothetical protein